MIRKPCSKLVRYKLLNQQYNKCVYCGLYFNKLNPPTFDHIIPFKYVGNSLGDINWVACCKICNLIKSAKLFESKQEIIDYVRTRKDLSYLPKKLQIKSSKKSILLPKMPVQELGFKTPASKITIATKAEVKHLYNYFNELSNGKKEADGLYQYFLNNP